MTSSEASESPKWKRAREATIKTQSWVRAEKEETMNNLTLTALHNFIASNIQSLNTYWSNEEFSLIQCLTDFEKLHNECLDKTNKIADLQEKLRAGSIAYNDLMEQSKKVMDEYTSDMAVLKDKISRRNLQIADLKKDREELLRLSALLGRLGYDLGGNKVD